jgi:hypothetical protein
MINQPKQQVTQPAPPPRPPRAAQMQQAMSGVPVPPAQPKQPNDMTNQLNTAMGMSQAPAPVAAAKPVVSAPPAAPASPNPLLGSNRQLKDLSDDEVMSLHGLNPKNGIMKGESGYTQTDAGGSTAPIDIRSFNQRDLEMMLNGQWSPEEMNASFSPAQQMQTALSGALTPAGTVGTTSSGIPLDADFMPEENSMDDYFAQGNAVIDDQFTRERANRERILRESAAARGLGVGDSPIDADFADMNSRLSEEERSARFDLMDRSQGFDLSRDQMAVQAKQFAAQFGMDETKLAEDTRRFGLQHALQAQGMAQDEAFRYASMAQDKALSTRGLDISEKQSDAQLRQLQQNFMMQMMNYLDPEMIKKLGLDKVFAKMFADGAGVVPGAVPPPAVPPGPGTPGIPSSPDAQPTAAQADWDRQAQKMRTMGISEEEILTSLGPRP